MEIRRFEDKDTDTVVERWYQTSIIAQNFISRNYGNKNCNISAFWDNTHKPQTYSNLESRKK